MNYGTDWFILEHLGSIRHAEMLEKKNPLPGGQPSEVEGLLKRLLHRFDRGDSPGAGELSLSNAVGLSDTVGKRDVSLRDGEGKPVIAKLRTADGSG